MSSNNEIFGQINGGCQQPFIVAEIGINHNGDLALAKEMIAAAAEAGANSVKFQNYRTEDFVVDKKLMFSYRSQGQRVTESQYEMFKRCELGIKQLEIIRDEAVSLGLDFHSTPTSVEGVNILKNLNCQIVKNGSDCLTNLRLVEEMGHSGMTTVLSTGMATLSEIADAVEMFKTTGNEKLVLLQCTSSYPAPASSLNLNQIQTLQKTFGVPVGFSDHSEGNDACVAATILGAVWIEKHFTLDKALKGPDHWFSLDPTELKSLVLSIKNASKMLGQGKISFDDTEKTGRESFTLSCVYSRDVKIGENIDAADLTFSRPGNGFRPKNAQFFIGRQIKIDVNEGELVKLEHFK